MARSAAGSLASTPPGKSADGPSGSRSGEVKAWPLGGDRGRQHLPGSVQPRLVRRERQLGRARDLHVRQLVPVAQDQYLAVVVRQAPDQSANRLVALAQQQADLGAVLEVGAAGPDQPRIDADDPPVAAAQRAEADVLRDRG